MWGSDLVIQACDVNDGVRLTCAKISVNIQYDAMRPRIFQKHRFSSRIYSEIPLRQRVVCMCVCVCVALSSESIQMKCF